MLLDFLLLAFFIKILHIYVLRCIKTNGTKLPFKICVIVFMYF